MATPHTTPRARRQRDRILPHQMVNPDTDVNCDGAYRRLAIAMLGLDVKTLTLELRAARLRKCRQSNFAWYLESAA